MGNTFLSLALVKKELSLKTHVQKEKFWWQKIAVGICNFLWLEIGQIGERAGLLQADRLHQSVVLNIVATTYHYV